MKKKILAIIPARENSKRLPNKNVKMFGEYPLVSWTIRAAQKCEEIERIIVSTDSFAVKKIAEDLNVEVPFLRPAELCQDDSTTVDVVFHTLDYLKKEEEAEYEWIILLQPTSPLRDNIDISNAIKFLEEKKAKAVISVSEESHSPLWSNTLPDDLSLKNFIPQQVKNIRSQELPKYYRLNGAIYICKTENFFEEKSFFLEDEIFAFVMPISKSIDIDSEHDFDCALSYLKKKDENQN